MLVGAPDHGLPDRRAARPRPPLADWPRRSFASGRSRTERRRNQGRTRDETDTTRWRWRSPARSPPARRSPSSTSPRSPTAPAPTPPAARPSPTATPTTSRCSTSATAASAASGRSVPECETAYDTTRGVECYEQVRGTSPLMLQPLSTGITYQIIPRVTEDEIPLHTMGYGRTSRRRRHHLRVGVQLSRHLLGRRLDHHQVPARRERRQPRRQEDRAPLPQLRLRQGADPHARGAEREARLHPHHHRRRQPGPGAEVAVAADPPRAPGLRADVGLGGDELGRRHRGRDRSASRWTTSSASGGRGPSPTCCRPAPAPTATRRSTSPASAWTSRSTPTSGST